MPVYNSIWSQASRYAINAFSAWIKSAGIWSDNTEIDEWAVNFFGDITFNQM